MRRRLSNLTAALCAVVVLAGCAEAAASAGVAPLIREALPSIEASSQQESELEDGVTEEEYRAAFTRFEACMDDAGSPLVRVHRNDSMIEYSMRAEAYDAGVSDRCYIAEFQQVDERWQFLNKDESVANRANRACLTAAGVTPKTTTEDVWAQILESGLDPTKCAQEYGPE